MPQPWYRTLNWGPLLVSFVTSWINFFQNGGHFPTSPEGWAIFVGTLVMWLWTAFNSARAASKTAIRFGHTLTSKFFTRLP